MISPKILIFRCLLVAGTIIQIQGANTRNDNLHNYLQPNQDRPLQTCANCNCPADYQPFCGSNRVTYSNLCNLECARNCNAGLRVHFEGVCAVPYNGRGRKLHHHSKHVDVDVKDGGRRTSLSSVNTILPTLRTTRKPPPTRSTQSPTEQPEVNRKPDPRCTSCPCTYDYSPICGSDGVVYANECVFRCAQRTCNSYLTRQTPTQCWEWAEEPTTLATLPPRPRTPQRVYRRDIGK